FNLFPTTSVFVSLFHLALSGTHATIEQRLTVIESLLKSSYSPRHALGVLALKSSLKTGHFRSLYSFEFGAQSRDYGYWPRTKGEARHWFRLTVALVE